MGQLPGGGGEHPRLGWSSTQAPPATPHGRCAPALYNPPPLPSSLLCSPGNRRGTCGLGLHEPVLQQVVHGKIVEAHGIENVGGWEAILLSAIGVTGRERTRAGQSCRPRLIPSQGCRRRAGAKHAPRLHGQDTWPGPPGPPALLPPHKQNGHRPAADLGVLLRLFVAAAEELDLGGGVAQADGPRRTHQVLDGVADIQRQRHLSGDRDEGRGRRHGSLPTTVEQACDTTAFLPGEQGTCDAAAFPSAERGPCMLAASGGRSPGLLPSQARQAEPAAAHQDAEAKTKIGEPDPKQDGQECGLQLGGHGVPVPMAGAGARLAGSAGQGRARGQPCTWRRQACPVRAQFPSRPLPPRT